MRTLFITIIFFIAHFVHAQNVEWAAFAGALKSTTANNLVVADNDDNVYIVGYNLGGISGATKIYTSLTQNYEQYSAGNAYLVKMSPEGEVLWVQTFSTYDTTIKLMAMTKDHENNIFVVGEFFRNMTVGYGGNSIMLHELNNRRDGFIAKFSPQGQVIAAYNLGGIMGDLITSIAFDNDNNIVLVGKFKYEVDFGINGNPEIIDCDGLMMVKYTPNFEFISAHSLPFYNVYKIHFTNDNKMIINGNTAGSISDINDNIICPGNGECTFILKYNHENEIEWGMGAQYPPDIDYPRVPTLRDYTLNANEDLFFVGTNQTSSSFYCKNGIFTIVSPFDQETAFMGKISADGNMEWQQKLNPDGSTQRVTSIVLDQDESIFVGGQYADTILNADYMITPLTRAILSKYSPQGDHINSEFYVPDLLGGSKIMGLAITSNSTIYVTGEFGGNIHFNPNQPDHSFIIYSGSINTHYIAKRGKFPVNIPFAEKPNPFIIYPNPTHNEVTITGRDLKKIEIYDLNGKLLKTEFPEAMNDTYTLKTHHLAAGVYMVSLTANGGFTTTQKLIINR